jgi:urea transporter
MHKAFWFAVLGVVLYRFLRPTAAGIFAKFGLPFA